MMNVWGTDFRSNEKYNDFRWQILEDAYIEKMNDMRVKSELKYALLEEDKDGYAIKRISNAALFKMDKDLYTFYETVADFKNSQLRLNAIKAIEQKLRNEISRRQEAIHLYRSMKEF